MLNTVEYFAPGWIHLELLTNVGVSTTLSEINLCQRGLGPVKRILCKNFFPNRR